MIKELQGHFNNAGKIRIGIVVARFNEFITKNLLAGALDALERYGVPKNHITLVWVPGSFEIPLAAKHLEKKKEVDAIICLGAIIRGATPHFEYISSQASSAIAQISLETGTPLIFGVLTTDTLEQAIERSGAKSGNKGFEAAQTAIEMIDLLHQF